MCATQRCQPQVSRFSHFSRGLSIRLHPNAVDAEERHERKGVVVGKAAFVLDCLRLARFHASNSIF